MASRTVTVKRREEKQHAGIARHLIGPHMLSSLANVGHPCCYMIGVRSRWANCRVLVKQLPSGVGLAMHPAQPSERSYNLSVALVEPAEPVQLVRAEDPFADAASARFPVRAPVKLQQSAGIVFVCSQFDYPASRALAKSAVILNAFCPSDIPSLFKVTSSHGLPCRLSGASPSPSASCRNGW